MLCRKNGESIKRKLTPLHQHAPLWIESHYYADGGCHKHSILPFFIDLITLYGFLFRRNMNYGTQLKEEVEKRWSWRWTTLCNLMKMNITTCERTSKYCLNVKWINDGNKCHCGMQENYIVGIFSSSNWQNFHDNKNI